MTENGEGIFYIVFLKHPIGTLKIIERLFLKFNLKRPRISIGLFSIKSFEQPTFGLANTIKLKNPPLKLIKILKKIPGIIIIEDRPDISVICF